MPEVKNPSWLTRARVLLEWQYDSQTGVFTRVDAGGNRTDRIGMSGGTIARGYRYLAVAGTHVLAHRLAWFLCKGKWPTRWVVHLNGERDDNRIANLGYKDEARYLTKKRLTQARLKQVLDYNAETGIFVWKINTARGRIGAHAGVCSTTGYRYMSIDAQRYLAHRLAWFYVHGSWPEHQIDHVNGKRDDNRIVNLREATPFQQAQNGSRPIGATGYRGVRRKGNRYFAQIMARNRRIPLGYFDTAEEAHAAYVEAAKKYHGDFVHDSSK